MSFREFLELFEAGGLFMNPGAAGVGQLHPLKNVDIYLHQYGSGGTLPATGPGLFSGSGPALGNQSPPSSPQRSVQAPGMKKMKKMEKS